MATRSLPPRTPKKFLKKPGHARTVPTPKDTPRSLPSLAPLIKARRLRAEIGDLMNLETLVCTPDEFMDCYMPPRDQEKTQKVLDLLLDAGILVPRNPNLPTTTESTQGAYRYVFKVFQQKPSDVKKGTKKRPQGDDGDISERTVNEILMFDNLGEVGQAILDALENVEGVKTNGYQIRMCPHKPITSIIEGHGHQIDAALTRNLNKKIPLLVTDIIIPFEFKLELVNKEGNRQQLVCHVNHTMNDDPRRLWVYGMTIEDDQVTIWYFSRSHSMMSTSFSFLDRADLLVEILVSFFCATDDQLGIDPNVKLVGKDAYVYRFPGDATNPEPAYYYTVDSIEEYRPLKLRCRATRLWKVTQVESFDNYDRITDKDFVLKETFLNSDAPSEMDIQQQLFEDVEKFRDDEGWCDREILSAFTKQSKRTLGAALNDFKEYFSCAIRQHCGNPGLAVPPGAQAVPNIFPVYTPPPEQPLGTTVRRMSGTQPVSNKGRAKKSTQKKKKPIEAKGVPPNPKALIPRRPCRVLFENVCTPLHDIPTLGEAMDILKQTAIALQIMFCAGWVHRDISSGNILALRAKGGGKWQVKLSDLEYAKKFPSQDPASTLPKTGTPYFMACEILKQDYFERVHYVRKSGHRKEPDLPKASVVHAYQHDLESIWWIILWLITMRISEDLPRKFGKSIFSNNPCASERKEVFEQKKFKKHKDLAKALPKVLKNSPFLSAVDNLRSNLLTEYVNRNGDNKHYDLASYSWIIGEGTKQFFEEISSTRWQWGNLEMKQKLDEQQLTEDDLNDESPPPSPTVTSNMRKGGPGPSKKPRLRALDKVKKMEMLF